MILLKLSLISLQFQRRQWHCTPVLLPGKSHCSLVGCSPWGREESDTTERHHFPFSLSCLGEGNGSPLQCSCLENPRDGGAWWAAVYGVAQSQTQLKWLSSSLQFRDFIYIYIFFFTYIYIYIFQALWLNKKTSSKLDKVIVVAFQIQH